VSIVLDIDPAAAAPIWRQIEDGVRRLVASGSLPPGAAVPSVRELARSLRVNPATVSKAYQLLSDAGLLVVRRGEGTFVAELESGARDAERARLLAEGAARLVAVARSMGATKAETNRAVDAAWREFTEGGEGTEDAR
jgi:GntR family transcriptional regulator